MRMIDIHCHVLPEMDDGAENIKESRKMLRMAYSQGIGSVIATPHYSGRYRNDCPERIVEKCRELEFWARENLDPEFRVYPGQEIFSDSLLWKKLERGEILTMAGSSFILLEFLPSAPYSEIYGTVRRAAMTPYRPVLAHVERYRELRKKGRPEELIEAGALLQMNYGSVPGKWYDKTGRWCRKMLENGYIHFLGTDMHGCKSRAPQTEEAKVWLNKRLNQDYVEELCFRNAEKYLLEKM